jgi:hypothetical protein
MVSILDNSDRARCISQTKIRATGNRIEVWIVGSIPVMFQIYENHGGFDVFTPHQAPREVDKILPWILIEGDTANGIAQGG